MLCYSMSTMSIGGLYKTCLVYAEVILTITMNLLSSWGHLNRCYNTFILKERGKISNLALLIMIHLASSGDEVKIWDAPSFSLLEQFNPHGGGISDICLNYDGTVFGSCCSTENTVHIRILKSTPSVPSTSFVLPVECLCLDFNSSSRYLLCGCKDGAVHIWDRKTQLFKKSFKNHKYPVTAARWNWNDTYIALGSENGEVLLYNVVTGQASSPMVAAASQAIRQVKYNPYHKASLTSVSDNGAVNIWDTNTRRLVHSFTSTHQAPTRDFAFSPINDCLMVSVGLDKRAVFYDVQNKVPIKTIMAEHPLTSVDMMHDGATVVMGTVRGKVYFYDMRQSSVPVFSLNAHRSSVRHLCFFKKEDGKSDKLSSQSLYTQFPNTPVSLTESPHQNANNSNTANLSPTHDSLKTQMDAFSPLGEVNKSSNSVTDTTSSEKSWMYKKTYQGDLSHTSQGVFSPLRNDNSHNMSSLHGTRNDNSHNMSSLHGTRNDNSHNMSSLHGTSSLLGQNSLIELFRQSENSANRDQVSSGSSQVVINNASHVIDSPCVPSAKASLSPPRHQRHQSTSGNGTSSGSFQISSPQGQVSPSPSSPLCHKLSSPKHKSPRTQSSPGQGISLDKRHHNIDVDAVNGSAASCSPEDLLLRAPDKVALDSSMARDGFSTSSPSVDEKVSTGTRLFLRQTVQELLKEQFREHLDRLRTDIRSMMGQSDLKLQPPISGDHVSQSVSSANPGMFHAEFIRNLIHEELEDVQELIHEECKCVRVEMIKQVFQLRELVEACFAECMINPVLLDEIERLREENANLKKTF